MYIVPQITQGCSQDTLDAFNTEALKLAIMGVTIVVAAGDNGAGFDETSCASASGSSDNNPGFWTVSNAVSKML